MESQQASLHPRDELVRDILSLNAGYTVSKWIIERIPHVFNDNFIEYINWKDRLSQLIGVDSKALVLTGSACVGYSLNPSKNFKPFDDASDIDVAVISSRFFDMCWHYLRNLGPAYHRLNRREKFAIDDHRTRLIYFGTIATDKIVHLLPFGADWVKAMNEMTDAYPTRDRDINFRIYRDFESLKAYQITSLTKVKDFLIEN